MTFPSNLATVPWTNQQTIANNCSEKSALNMRKSRIAIMFRHKESASKGSNNAQDRAFASLLRSEVSISRFGPSDLSGKQLAQINSIANRAFPISDSSHRRTLEQLNRSESVYLATYNGSIVGFGINFNTLTGILGVKTMEFALGAVDPIFQHRGIYGKLTTGRITGAIEDGYNEIRLVTPSLFVELAVRKCLKDLKEAGAIRDFTVKTIPTSTIEYRGINVHVE